MTSYQQSQTGGSSSITSLRDREEENQDSQLELANDHFLFLSFPPKWPVTTNLVSAEPLKTSIDSEVDSSELPPTDWLPVIIADSEQP